MENFAETALTEASRADASGRIRVTILTPGWGSSGYYSEQVVKESAGLVKPGTPMYLDHASNTERFDRPGRSVKDIAAKFVTESEWDPTARETFAMAELVPGPYRDTLVALEDSIGVSINGSARDMKHGEAEGRKGKIVEGLADITSVDFVTRAGRGGKFSSVFESALLEAAVMHVDEATASDRMNHLRDTVKATHGTDGVGAWVRDQDAEKAVVYFDVHDLRGDNPSKTYSQSYKVGRNDVDVELTGNPTEVKPVTKYVTATRPDSTTTESQEDNTMKQIEEAEFTRLTESAGRVDELSEKLVTEKARGDAAEAELARRDRADQAAILFEAKAHEHKVTFSALEARGVLADLPVKEGKLDEEAFTKTVEAAIADKTPQQSTSATGRVTGFGAAVAEGSTVQESATVVTATPWGRKIEKGA